MKKTTLGTTIAELRKKHGMTQLELANKMGVTDKAVSKWERNLSCPDISSLPLLAEVLGVSVGELMQNSPEPEKQESISPVLPLALKGIALAMGIAVTVLSALDQLDVSSGITMLGIGLACISLTLWQKS